MLAGWANLLCRCSCWRCGGGGFGGRELGRDERDLFDDVEAGAAEELVDEGLCEAAGVVLHADGFFLFLEVDLADAVDLAKIGDGHGCGFGGWRSKAVQDVKLGHMGMMIAVRGLARAFGGS